MLVVLTKYLRPPKLLSKEQEFMRNKESELRSIFIFWISSILRFIQLMKFSGFFLLDSAVKSLNWSNNYLRFGGALNVNMLFSFVYLPTDDSFMLELL